MKILVIKNDFQRFVETVDDSEITIKFLQNILGGEVELFKLNEEEMLAVNKQTVGLQLNRTASYIYKRETGVDMEICGDALIMSETNLFK